MPQQTSTLGADFARAFADKDAARIRELLHPEIDFRGLTPSRAWEATGPDAVLEILFGSWVEESDQVEALEAVEEDSVADRERVGYRCSVTNPDGRFVFEQQAYLEPRDGRIGWMRVVCSGFRPVD
jgi:SnoaL-like domain